MKKQDNQTNQNSKEDVVIGSVKRDPLKLFRKKDQNIITGKDINNTNTTNSDRAIKQKQKPKDSKPKKAFKLAYIATIVVLVVSVLLNIYFVANNKKQELSLDEFIVNTQNKSLYGQSDIAIQEISNREDLKNTLEQQLLISASHFNSGDYQKALDVLLQAEKNFPINSDLMRLIAINYEALSNKEKALEYRAKQLEQIKIGPDYPTKNQDIDTLQKLLNNGG